MTPLSRPPNRVQFLWTSISATVNCCSRIRGLLLFSLSITSLTLSSSRRKKHNGEQTNQTKTLTKKNQSHRIGKLNHFEWLAQMLITFFECFSVFSLSFSSYSDTCERTKITNKTKSSAFTLTPSLNTSHHGRTEIMVICKFVNVRDEWRRPNADT